MKVIRSIDAITPSVDNPFRELGDVGVKVNWMAWYLSTVDFTTASITTKLQCTYTLYRSGANSGLDFLDEYAAMTMSQYAARQTAVGTKTPCVFNTYPSSSTAAVGQAGAANLLIKKSTVSARQAEAYFNAWAPEGVVGAIFTIVYDIEILKLSPTELAMLEL